MYRKSLALDEALGRKAGMASNYTNLGNVYKTRGDLDQAEAMYRKGLELFKGMGAQREVEHVQALLDELRIRG